MYQVFLYMRDPANSNEADSNHYAFPLPVSPVIECVNYKVVRVDVLPTGADATVKPLTAYQPKPANEYIPETQELRKDLKPLHVNQPEGPSFSVTPVGETGNVLSWQKWNFFVGMLFPKLTSSFAMLTAMQVSTNVKEWCYTTSNTTTARSSIDYHYLT